MYMSFNLFDETCQKARTFSSFGSKWDGNYVSNVSPSLFPQVETHSGLGVGFHYHGSMMGWGRLLDLMDFISGSDGSQAKMTTPIKRKCSERFRVGWGHDENED